MEESFNAVNDAQRPNVEAGAADSAPDGAACGGQEQTRQENAAFAALRRQGQAKAAELARRGEAYTEARAQEIDGLNERLDALTTQLARDDIRRDLEQIRAQHPEFDADDMRALPEDFVRLMATGQVDALTAYEVVAARQKRAGMTPPAPAGAVKTTPGRDKDFYSPAEVDAITRSDLRKNPKLLDIVQRSMTRWNKN